MLGSYSKVGTKVHIIPSAIIAYINMTYIIFYFSSDQFIYCNQVIFLTLSHFLFGIKVASQQDFQSDKNSFVRLLLPLGLQIS